MIDKIAKARRNRRMGTDIAVSLGLAAVILFFVISAAVSYRNTKVLNGDSQQIVHSHDVMLALRELLSLMKDAEAGQRGYLITGQDKYLEPYSNAIARIEARLAEVKTLTSNNATQQERIPILKSHIGAKLAELAETIGLRRSTGFDAARAVVVTDRGKEEMDIIRDQIGGMNEEELSLRLQRLTEINNAYQVAVISGILTGLLGVLVSVIVGYLVRRTSVTRQRQEWLQSGHMGLNAAMAGNLRTEQLGEHILKFLARYLDAQAGVFYVSDDNKFKRIATYGVADTNKMPLQFAHGEGLPGQAAKDGRAFQVRDISKEYLTVSSALGQGKPRHLIIAPTMVDGIANAVLELGFMHPLNELTFELLDQTSESIGIALRTAHYRSNLQNLLEETQRQAEELQSQSEELRVSNEELEEQSRALKMSQVNLEQQQAELEQTNSQLEEQTQLLEVQKDDLLRVKESVQRKAQELEQASQYKSDFLANMSHELRTPLNSSLILAKLLADNPESNLTPEQVKYARTIQSSGNDLLALINDILDLSKIEAGHMEMRPEKVALTRLMKDLTATFQPLAEQKGLVLHTRLTPGCPTTIETDQQRFSQVLRNLLANAIKFTEHGKVELTIARAADGKIDFAISDTGIGIAADQQQAIFDAFRQADGTISRKYGGTGLGLSISRELMRLLGGSMQLVSKPDEGSTFTVTVPETYDSSVAHVPMPMPAVMPFQPHRSAHSQTPAQKPAIYIEDDREQLTENGRVILVIEDDESFARVLYDLAHELDFQCLIASTAEDAMILARQYLPNAVVLDIGLPDHSGLLVLDRLKHDARMRHIPIHVISGQDNVQTSLSLGAVGHMVKPVKRDELAGVLRKLEKQFAKHLRRVLIVEDDRVQRESMCKLLGSREVETVGVGTAAECLERLKENTFDCMVLDLSLPDASGYSLLETLSREDAYSFPPVIVYTGRDISADEEQRLRRYSKSIIIKGAKSPERLLDEVTLFLHQVVSELPPEQQRMLERARNRDTILEGRHILIVEDDIRNVYALTSILEPHGAVVCIARNGLEALDVLKKKTEGTKPIDLVLMDVMMPEMDGLTATREIRKNPVLSKLPVIMLTAKAMKDDQERCLQAGANDYMAKPLDVDKLLSLVRVWMPR